MWFCKLSTLFKSKLADQLSQKILNHLKWNQNRNLLCKVACAFTYTFTVQKHNHKRGKLIPYGSYFMIYECRCKRIWIYFLTRLFSLTIPLCTGSFNITNYLLITNSYVSTNLVNICLALKDYWNVLF